MTCAWRVCWRMDPGKVEGPAIGIRRKLKKRCHSFHQRANSGSVAGFFSQKWTQDKSRIVQLGVFLRVCGLFLLPRNTLMAPGSKRHQFQVIRGYHVMPHLMSFQPQDLHKARDSSAVCSQPNPPFASTTRQGQTIAASWPRGLPCRETCGLTFKSCYRSPSSALLCSL